MGLRRVLAATVKLVILVDLLGPSHVAPLFGKTAQGSAVSSALPKGQSDNGQGSSSAGTVLYIQTVRYKSSVSTAQIDELLGSLQHTLIRISEVKSIRIGRIVDDSRQYDYAIAMQFDNLNDLRSYASSPIHRQWVQSHNPGPLTQGHMTLTIQMGL